MTVAAAKQTFTLLALSLQHQTVRQDFETVPLPVAYQSWVCAFVDGLLPAAMLRADPPSWAV